MKDCLEDVDDTLPLPSTLRQKSSQRGPKRSKSGEIKEDEGNKGRKKIKNDIQEENEESLQ